MEAEGVRRAVPAPGAAPEEGMRSADRVRRLKVVGKLGRRPKGGAASASASSHGSMRWLYVLD